MTDVRVISPEGEEGLIPEENLEAAAARGFSVIVISPEGEKGSIPYENLNKALSSGFTIPDLAPSKSAQTQAAAAGAVRGATAGLSDLGIPIISGVAGAIEETPAAPMLSIPDIVASSISSGIETASEVADSVMQGDFSSAAGHIADVFTEELPEIAESGARHFRKQDVFGGNVQDFKNEADKAVHNFNVSRETTKNKLRELKAEYPTTSTASEIGGAVVGALIPVTPAGGISSLGMAVTKGIAKKAGAGVVRKGAGVLAGSAIEGAFFNTGMELSEVALGNKELTAEGITASAVGGAILGGALGLGVTGLTHGAIRGGKWGINKLAKMSDDFSISGRNIDVKDIEYFGVKKGTPEYEQLKDVFAEVKDVAKYVRASEKKYNVKIRSEDDFVDILFKDLNEINKTSKELSTNFNTFNALYTIFGSKQTFEEIFNNPQQILTALDNKSIENITVDGIEKNLKKLKKALSSENKLAKLKERISTKEGQLKLAKIFKTKEEFDQIQKALNVDDASAKMQSMIKNKENILRTLHFVDIDNAKLKAIREKLIDVYGTSYEKIFNKLNTDDLVKKTGKTWLRRKALGYILGAGGVVGGTFMGGVGGGVVGGAAAYTLAAQISEKAAKSPSINKVVKGINRGLGDYMPESIRTLGYLERVKGSSLDGILTAADKILTTGTAVSSTQYFTDADRSAARDLIYSFNNTTPTNVVEVIDKETPNLTRHAPELALQLQITIDRAQKYLQAHAPRNPYTTGTFLHKQWKPSNTELYKMAIILRAIQDPAGVIERVKQGQASITEINAVRTVYPRLYALISEQIIETIADKELTHKQRKSISEFLGADLDKINNIDFIQNINGLAQEASPPPTPTKQKNDNKSFVQRKKLDISTQGSEMHELIKDNKE